MRTTIDTHVHLNIGGGSVREALKYLGDYEALYSDSQKLGTLGGAVVILEPIQLGLYTPTGREIRAKNSFMGSSYDQSNHEYFEQNEGEITRRIVRNPKYRTLLYAEDLGYMLRLPGGENEVEDILQAAKGLGVIGLKFYKDGGAIGYDSVELTERVAMRGIQLGLPSLQFHFGPRHLSGFREAVLGRSGKMHGGADRKLFERLQQEGGKVYLVHGCDKDLLQDPGYYSRVKAGNYWLGTSNP